MSQLPEMMLPTVKRIYQKYEETCGDWRRDHLGASQIGIECQRALWYTFRWASRPNFDGRMYRLFETGNQQEPRLVSNLRSIGVMVYDRDPETGEQFHFEEFGGHYAGSMDAAGVGFEESKKWHVIEFKTSSAKAFAYLTKNAVERAKPEHYAQMQQYMLWAGLERAFYFSVCKDTDEIYAQRVSIDKPFAGSLSKKAHSIIFSDEPPLRHGTGVSDAICRFCAYKGICHNGDTPEINCRTCSMSTPIENGTWVCRNDGSMICKAKQRSAHGCHELISDLLVLK